MSNLLLVVFCDDLACRYVQGIRSNKQLEETERSPMPFLICDTWELEHCPCTRRQFRRTKCRETFETQLATLGTARKNRSIKARFGEGMMVAFCKDHGCGSFRMDWKAFIGMVEGINAGNTCYFRRRFA